VTKKPLSDYRHVRGRFVRSVNVERDAGTGAVEGYLPTGRSLDAVRRFARSLVGPDASRALSITGPYGSGKSSLAVFLDALGRSAKDPARSVAEEILALTDPDTLVLLREGRQRVGADDTGFIRAVITAEREPVTLTVLRALRRGADQFDARGRRETLRRRILRLLENAIRRFGDPAAARPTTQAVLEALEGLVNLAPVLLLIDEFGKNLEGYTDAPADGDLYLLQQLAEWSHGHKALPLVTLTLQHLAFAEYVPGASEGQRRELAKVQGRFEDIPFVDTPTQTRSLIGAAWESTENPAFQRALDSWAREQLRACRDAGLSELFDGADQIAGCWPLHPVAQLVLPELCSRYGQNERTLFSFLASDEPASVASFLRKRAWNAKEALPSLGVDRVYDYFIESAGTIVGVAQSASRWLEIETLIRDAMGLGDTERRALKTIGVLNLISAGGALRASRAAMTYSLTGGQEPGARSRDQVAKLLESLERRGLVTFRDFADEYRLWQGSDFDLRAALETARRRLRSSSPAAVLARVKPLSPVVAARHSQQSHTLRAFARSWADNTTRTLSPPTWSEPADGLAAYLLDPTAPLPEVVSPEPNPKPVVMVRSNRVASLLESAVEVAALQEVLATEERLETDWVVRRELGERIAEASQRLDAEFESAFGGLADAKWLRAAPGVKPARVSARAGTSAVLSAIADDAFHLSPQLRNEMLNRTELTSQGAKARRMLLEAMLTRSKEAALGIVGYGPERAMYEAALATTGIHRCEGGVWGFWEPRKGSTFHAAWSALVAEFSKAKAHRIGIDQVLRRLMGCPIGMRAGAAPVLVTAALIVQADEIAIYEHGTYRPSLTPELSERMVRNPAHFEIKHFATKGGVRRHIIDALTTALGLTSRPRPSRNGSILGILGHLVTHLVIPLPEYVRRTSILSPEALAVRKALLSATEPDALLFGSLPQALGHPPIPATASRRDWLQHSSWIPEFLAVIEELRAAYPALLVSIEGAIVEATGAPSTDYRTALEGRVKNFGSEVVDPRMRAFLSALEAPLERDEWLAYVASTVAGRPPDGWTDDDRARFMILIRDLGAAFRRLEALHYDRHSRASLPADALRVTFTRPDGQEDAHVVWVDAVQREILANRLNEFLQAVGDVAGSSARARDAVLALLAPSARGADESVGPETGDVRISGGKARATGRKGRATDG
jgi:hypothetical protein